MATELTGYQINYDQDISVSMTFEITAEGNPDSGFTITRAVLLEMAVWLERDKAEEPQVVCLDRTAWLNKFLAAEAGEQRKIDEALAEQWDRDHEDDYLYRNPSWRQAVAHSVD